MLWENVTLNATLNATLNTTSPGDDSLIEVAWLDLGSSVEKLVDRTSESALRLVGKALLELSFNGGCGCEFTDGPDN